MMNISDGAAVEIVDSSTCQWSASLARSNRSCRKAVFSFQHQEADRKDAREDVVTKTGHIDFQVKNGPMRHLSFLSLTSFLPQSSSYYTRAN